MKITKRQLRRIIKEERAKLLSEERFIIMKGTRAMPDGTAVPGNAYSHPVTTGKVGVEPGRVYASREEAEVDAQKLNSLPGVGFVVVRLAESSRQRGTKLLRESITDMVEYEDMITKVARQLSDNFGEDMLQAAKDEPSMISTSFEEWEEQVVYAQQELESALEMAMSDVIQEIEAKLDNGDYYRLTGR